MAFAAGQVADGEHQGALGLDGIKARIGEEAKETLLAREVVALGKSGHTGARQFGEGEGATVEDGGGEQGQASWRVRWRAFEEGCG